MEKELVPHAPQNARLNSPVRLGIALPKGTEFDPARVQFLKETRLLFPDAKITAFTYKKHWGELDIFDYFDDVAAVSDDDEEALQKIVKKRDIDIYIDTSFINSSKPSGVIEPSAPWSNHFKYCRRFAAASDFAGDIYVKNCTIPADMTNAITALGTVAVGHGALHQDISLEIRTQAPMDKIVLSPWTPGRAADPARTHALWADIGRQLIAAGFELVLVGAVEDHPAAIALRGAMGETGVQLAVGRSTLRQTAIMLGRAQGVLSAPGPIAGLAALAGTPMVVLDSLAAAPATLPTSQAVAAVNSLKSLLSRVSGT